MVFDEIINRKNTNSVKWDLASDDDVLPMWVADMDFRAPPAIVNAMLKAANHGVFGYTIVPPIFYESIVQWWGRQHQHAIDREAILPMAGVMQGISAILRTYLKKGDRVIVQPPVYNRFFQVVRNCDCLVVENNLISSGDGYIMDFDDLTKKASDPQAKVLLLCNPHNPVGRVWRRDELELLAVICSKNDVMVISDEVHCDLVFHNNRHIPFASIVEKHGVKCFTCGSPGKAFNLSGLQIAYLLCPDTVSKSALKKVFELQATTELSPISIEALVSAYTSNDNKDWLQQLNHYLYENYNFLCAFCNENLPGFKVTKLEGTYLVWVDCSSLGKTSKELSTYLLEKAKLWVNAGSMYGEAGEGFLRINIACTRTTLIDGLARLGNAYKAWIAS